MWCLSATWTLPYQNWPPPVRTTALEPDAKIDVRYAAWPALPSGLVPPVAAWSVQRGLLCGDDATGIIWPSWEPVSRIKVWVAAWLTTPGQVVSKQDPSLLINDGSSLCIDRLTEHPEAQRRARPSHKALASHACHGTSLFTEEPACGQRPTIFRMARRRGRSAPGCRCRSEGGRGMTSCSLRPAALPSL